MGPVPSSPVSPRSTVDRAHRLPVLAHHEAPARAALRVVVLAVLLQHAKHRFAALAASRGISDSALLKQLVESAVIGTTPEFALTARPAPEARGAGAEERNTATLQETRRKVVEAWGIVSTQMLNAGHPMADEVWQFLGKMPKPQPEQAV